MRYIKSKWFKVFAVILSVYLLSAMIQVLFPVEQKPHANQKKELINWDDTFIDFNYLEFEGERGSPDPVLLLPDPFYKIKSLEPFIEQISQHHRVIVPIYPAEDVHGNRISRSSQTRAKILSRWLTDRSETNIHLAGHGFGNAVAIDLLHLHNREQLTSYTLLAALGVQELNFLGNHVLNKSIYPLLYPTVWFLEYGIPHAGWVDYLTFNRENVHYLNSLDQRNYRKILQTVDLPSLVLHDETNTSVLVGTAQEHHRILPQSELQVFSEDEDSITDSPQKWANAYTDFLFSVENGSGITRGIAETDRKNLARKPFDPSVAPPLEGWGLIIVLSLLIVATLFSEDLGCIGAGLMIAGGMVNFWPVFLVCYFGIIIADVGIYWMGRILGRPVINRAPFKWFINRKDVEWSEMMFNQNGFKIIFASRFLPGTRFPTYFTAGILKTNFNLFLLYFVLSISFWAPLILGASVFAGQRLLQYLEIYQQYAPYILIGFIVGLYLFFKLILPLATKKGRREFAVKMIRMKQRFVS